MTDKSEPKEAQPSCTSCGEGGKILMVALLGLFVGMLVMYIAMPALVPAAPGPSEGEVAATGTQGGEEPFVLNEAKVQEIGQLLSDTYLLNTGEDVTVTYVRYESTSNHIVLYYSVMGQEMPIYTSKDYTYLYPSAIDRAEMAGEVAVVKAQYLASLAAEPAEPVATGMQTSETPKVQLFLMSNCPYGNQAENGIMDVVYLLEEEIEFEPVYIISGSDGNYNSLHGPYELNQGIREKIVYNLYGEKKWMEFTYDVNVNCFNTANPSATIDACWKEAATRTGVDIAAVEAEYTANFNAIADGEVAKTNAAGVSGSPTLIMNGAKYSGARTPESFKAWICTGFTEEPDQCGQALSEEGAAAAGSC